MAPHAKLRSLEAPRLARIARWWVAGSGRNLSAGPVTTAYAVLGRENRLGLLPHPQPLADLVHETRHRASLRLLADRNAPPERHRQSENLVGSPRWQDRGVTKQEGIGQRIKRLRLEHGLSQRDLSSPGISYAYISRIEADARTPSVKALRRIAGNLGVTVEHLETGKPTPTEAVADAGLDFGSLTNAELRAIRAAAAEGAQEGARRAAKQVIESRREAEVAELRKRLKDLGG